MESVLSLFGIGSLQDALYSGACCVPALSVGLLLGFRALVLLWAGILLFVGLAIDASELSFALQLDNNPIVLIFVGHVLGGSSSCIEFVSVIGFVPINGSELDVDIVIVS